MRAAPLRRSEVSTRFCESCGGEIGWSRTISPSVYMKTRFCSYSCAAKRGKNTHRDTYAKLAHTMIGDSCETCETSEGLVAHHANRDWSDNSEENVKTLCRRCHGKHHYDSGDMSDAIGKKGSPPCVICGKPIKALGWCEKHYMRNRRWGSPYAKHAGSPRVLVHEGR